MSAWGAVLFLLGIIAPVTCVPLWGETASDRFDPSAERGPVDVALVAGGTELVTANQIAGSVSLIKTSSGEILDELACGSHPTKVIAVPHSNRVLVSCSHSGSLSLVEINHQQLSLVKKFELGFEPTGITVRGDGQRAYVGLVASGQVAIVDLVQGVIERVIDVGHWPRYLAVSADGKRLAVGLSGESKVVVVDTEKGEISYDVALSGAINLGQMQIDKRGEYVYFPWMIYRTNPINPGNIRLGWVLASRIARVRLDGPATREAISLDVPRMAVADPHGICFCEDESRMVVSASGTHELLVYRVNDLPFIGAGGPGDLIDRRLLADSDLFYRIDVAGRPMGLAADTEHSIVYVANDLRNSVQWVDIRERKVVKEVNLGGKPLDALVHRGREIFYDGRRSLDQWYSCHTCHYDGGISSRPMDTMNDGSPQTLKTVLPLEYVHETGPWTWHGWQADLGDSIQKSFVETMQGNHGSKQDVEALTAYLTSLKLPPNPYQKEANELRKPLERGKELFHGNRANCVACHSGSYFTDGEIHDVGTGSESDFYKGYNTPSLRGVYRKVRLMHDGRARSLEALLKEHHTPEKIGVGETLSDAERNDLILYLKSL